MAQNLQIDPTKRDYVVVNGSPVPSDRVLEACYYAMLIPRGKWLYGDTGQGSLLFQLQNVKRSASVEQQFAGFTLDAVQSQVIAVGKATQAAVRNLAASRTGSSNELDVVPSNTQLSQQLNFVSV